MEDRELIARIQQGDVELYRLLVDRYHRPLLTFIYSLLRDRRLTEDVGQDVFLAFYLALDRFDTALDIPVSAWLFTAARNQALNVIKKERRTRAVDIDQVAVTDSRPGPLDLLVRREDQDALERCLQQLPEPYRTTLRQSLRGDSLREIGAHTLALPGTVKSRLSRAKEKLLALVRAELVR